MNIWKILEIDETKDKDELKKAYRNKLTKVNPEDNPEGFMELRAAYEEALRASDIAVTVMDENESDVLTMIKELYSDFDKRKCVAEWEKLFDTDEFVSLDTTEESFDTLFRFLMEKFHLPKRVWKCIVETFDVSHRKKELCEKYPTDFIDYVLSNANYDDLINYDLFDGNSDCFDEYIDKYYELDAAIRRRDIDNEKRLIDYLEDLDCYHPYSVMSKIRCAIHNMYESNGELNREKHSEELCELQNMIYEELENSGNDIYMLCLCGDVALIREDYDVAKKYYDRAKEQQPDNYIVKGKQAELAFASGEYESARDTYIELLKINHYDNGVRAGMIRANSKIIEKLTAKIADNPNDNDSKLEMAWSYYQSYSFNEGISILDTFIPTDEKKCEYYNVKGRSYLCLFLYDKALECFKIWKDEIEKIPEDDKSDEAVKKKKRYEYVNFLIADCYLKTKKYDEARVYLKKALEKKHEEILLSCEAMCELEFECGNYDKCIDACEDLLNMDERNFLAYSYLSKSYFELEYYNEALRASEKCIGIYPYMADPYSMQVRIFIMHSQFEHAMSVIGRYESLGIESDQIDYYKARIFKSQKKYVESEKLLDDIFNRYKSDNTDLEDKADLYFLKGELCEIAGKYDYAIKTYRKAIEINSEHKYAYGRLSCLLLFSGNTGEALKYINKQIELAPHAFYFATRARIYKQMMRYNEAIVDYERSVEYDIGEAYLGLAEVYEAILRFDLAKKYYDLIINLDVENARYKKNAIIGKARILDCQLRFVESDILYKSYLKEHGLDLYVVDAYYESLVRSNQPEIAIALIKKGIAKLEDHYSNNECKNILCDAYGEIGEVEKAKNYANQLVEAKRENASDEADIYGRLAYMYNNRGMYKEARKYYLKSIALDSDNCKYYAGIVMSMSMINNILYKQNIISYSEKIIELCKPERSIDYVYLAWAYVGLKKYDKAIEHFKQATKTTRCPNCRKSECVDAWYGMACLFKKLKNNKSALECMKKAKKLYGHNKWYDECIDLLTNMV